MSAAYGRAAMYGASERRRHPRRMIQKTREFQAMAALPISYPIGQVALTRPSMVCWPSVAVAPFVPHENFRIVSGRPDLIVRYLDDAAKVSPLDTV